MAEWSDWHTKEDPTGWVLAQILRDRAERHPDRDPLEPASNPWVMLPHREELRPVRFGISRAGAVTSSIDTA